VVNIPDVLIGGVSGAGIVVATSTWLGKVWATRLLERDRVKYETQMQAALSRDEINTLRQSSFIEPIHG